MHVTYLESEDVEGDDASDLREDGECGGEEEEADEAGALRGAAHPPDQTGEEQREAHTHHRVREDLERAMHCTGSVR